MYGGGLREPAPLSREAAERWYAQVCADPLAWVIEAEGRCVGVVRLHSLVDQDRRARLAIGLFHPDLLGSGIGTRAIRLLPRHGFETMRLHRVDLRGAVAQSPLGSRFWRAWGAGRVLLPWPS